MRVVAGDLRGRTLRAPAGRHTRPTADRVREAVFSMLGPVAGLTVLDLFAGSGALGIEAASRGATAVTFVDSDPRAVAAVRRNLAELGLEAEVARRDAIAYLRGRPGSFDLVFLDPPYSSARRLAAPLAERLPGILTDGARIVTESDRRHPLELALPLVRERIYGDTRIAIHLGA
jgi:16S rRNA (guanine966-N2)-methyltransferase